MLRCTHWQWGFVFINVISVFQSEKLCIWNSMSGQWSVACSRGLFVEKGVSRVKGSEMIFFALLAACLRCNDCNDRKERPVSVNALVTAYSSLFVSLAGKWFQLQCSFSVPRFVYFVVHQANYSKFYYQTLLCGFVICTLSKCIHSFMSVLSQLLVSQLLVRHFHTEV